MNDNIRQGLRHSDYLERKKALGTLALIGGGDNEAYTWTYEMLADKNANVRVAALRACLLIKPEKRLENLQILLRDSHHVAREAAVTMAFAYNVSELLDTLYDIAVHDEKKNVQHTCLQCLLEHNNEFIYLVVADILNWSKLKCTFPEEHPWYIPDTHPLKIPWWRTASLVLEIAVEYADDELLDIIQKLLQDYFPVDPDNRHWKYGIIRYFLTPGFKVLCNHRLESARYLAEQVKKIDAYSYDYIIKRVPTLTRPPSATDKVSEVTSLEIITLTFLRNMDTRDRPSAIRFAMRILKETAPYSTGSFLGVGNYGPLAIAAQYFSSTGEKSAISTLISLLPHPQYDWHPDQKQFIGAVVQLSEVHVREHVKKYFQQCRYWGQYYFLSRLAGSTGNPDYVPLLVPIATGKASLAGTNHGGQFGGRFVPPQAKMAIKNLLAAPGGEKHLEKMLTSNDWKAVKLGIEINQELGLLSSEAELAAVKQLNHPNRSQLSTKLEQPKYELHIHKGQPFIEPYTGIQFVWIPAGEFYMGADEKEEEEPIHNVSVPGFWLGKYLVTQEQWLKVMDKNGSRCNYGGRYPVDSTTWALVEIFLTLLKEKSGRQFRLPSEAEWEYAARCGSQQHKWFGTNDENLIENWLGSFGDCSNRVGKYTPNNFGLYDMTGNVMEWCEDVWHANYDGAPTDGTARKTGDNKDKKVVRGLPWFVTPPQAFTTTRRHGGHKDSRNSTIGFRVACSARKRGSIKPTS